MVSKHWIVLSMAVGIGLALIVLVPGVYVCGVVFGLWQPVTRPPGVSATARYVSRIEDGTWFDCSVNSERNVDICKAWGSDGRFLADGDFRLECEARPATKAELRPSAVNSSGGHAYAIYLFGERGAESKILVPVTNWRDTPCPQVTITYPSAPRARGTSDKPSKK
jgi:hypothetical protein